LDTSLITANLASVKTLDASASTGGVVFDATASNATLTGGSGNDDLADGSGNDIISGGAGADTITGGSGNDSLDAGAGDDVVIASSVNTKDTIAGGDGTDTLSLAAMIATSTTEVTGTGVSGFEVLETTAGLTQDMLMIPNSSIAAVRLNTGTTVLQSAPAVTTATFKGAATYMDAPCLPSFQFVTTRR
jgi:Ca2+-binding RTX toxin-like protein